MSNSPRGYRQPPSAPTGQMDGQKVSESTRRAYILAQKLKEVKLENPITGLSDSLEVSYLDDDDDTDQITLTNTSTATKRVEINLNEIAKLGTDFTPSNAADVYLRRGGETIWQAGTDNSFRLFPSNGALKFGIYGVGPAGQPSPYTLSFSTTSRTLSAYTSDTESVAYTGLATGLGGTPYASVTDANALRTAYETLRASHDSLIKVVVQLINDLQAYGWLA